MKILYAIDLHDPDPESRIALAVEWAETMNATLDLLYVAADTVEYWSPTGAPDSDHLRSRQEERLGDLIALIPEDHRGVALRRQGHAPTEIASAAKSYGLLLVASHGRRGPSRFLIGSVAERVLRSAPIPTLVLRIP